MLGVRLVGELGIELDGRRLEPPTGHRARSLLAWFAFHPGLHPRSAVASVFWPDVLERSARASLRTALTGLRRELGPAAGHLVADRERVGLDDGAGLRVDVREAEELVAAGRVEEALERIDGELLTDLDDDWVLTARTDHRHRRAELLARLAEAASEPRDAVAYARRRHELDPLSEEAARALMRHLAAAGDRADAVAAYERFVATLRRDLRVAPSEATRALATELRGAAAERRERTTALPLPAALVRGDLPPLLERAEPLDRLRGAWRAAASGAAVAVVRSEAGGGKTRLLGELAGELHAREATVLAGRCLEDEAVAYAPFAEALRPYLATAVADLPEWVAAELSRLLPELGGAPPATHAEPRDARHRLFEAVAFALGAAARRGRIALVVEDLHWADRLTMEVLSHVVRTLGWAPVLVVVSLRTGAIAAPDALARLLDDLRRARRLTEVPLAGLSEAAVAKVAAHWLGGPPPPGLVAEVHRRSGGNPLFVEELLRHAAEGAGEEVPRGVRGTIARRLTRLPRVSRNAVEIGAVAGEEFALADVAAALELPDESVAASLEAAGEAGIVAPSAAPGRYRFAHALVRDAVLSALGPTPRALAHRRLALAIEQRDGGRPGEVAHHLLEAGPLADARHAARCALAAGVQALRNLAYEDAAALLERAAAALPAGDPLRAEVALALGDARLHAGDDATARRCFSEVVIAARALADVRLLARAALGAAGLAVTVAPVRDDVRSLLEEALAGLDEEDELRPLVLARLAIELYYARPPARREELSAAALAAGRQRGGPALLAALNARHVALWSPAHVEQRLAIADEMIAAARASGDREIELQAVNWRVLDLVELGDRSGALAAIEEHERLAGELRLAAFAWWGPLWRAMFANVAGRGEEAERLSAAGRRLGRLAGDENAELLFEIQRLGISSNLRALSPDDRRSLSERALRSPAFPAWEAWLGVIAMGDGDLETSGSILSGRLPRIGELPFDANWLYTTTALGLIAARLGSVAAARALYPLIAPYARQTVIAGRGTACTGSAALSAGLLARLLGDLRAAREHLELAVERNDAMEATPFAAAGRVALASLLEAQSAATDGLRARARAAVGALGDRLPPDVGWLLAEV